MTSRVLLACGTVAIAALLATGCTATAPAGAWVVSPVDTSNGEFADSDITFGGLKITDDTAGGVWVESAGSWIGVDSDGEITRFTDDMVDGVSTPPALDIAALSPTEIYVLRPFGSGVVNTTVELFDTSSRHSATVFTGQRVQTSPAEPLPFTADGAFTRASPLGPICSIDVDGEGRLVFVERVDLAEHASDRYIVRRMLPGGAIETLAGSADPTDTTAAHQSPRNGEQLRGMSLAAASVDITAGDPDGVIVSTAAGVFQITADGTARVIDGALPETSPAGTMPNRVLGVPERPVDAAPDGRVVFSAALFPDADDVGAAHISGGSDRFTQLVRGDRDPHRHSGFVVDDDGITASDALNQARTAVWVSPGVLVAVIPGSGDESALARVRLAPTHAGG